MIQPAQMQGGSSDDGLVTFGLIAAVIVGAGWFAWYRYHPEIAAGVILCQHWQMEFIGSFNDRYLTLDAQALAFDPAHVTAKTLFKLCHLVGLFFRIPSALFLAILSFLCLTRASPARFTRTLDFDQLSKVQAQVFRTGAAFVGRNLKPVPIADGEPRPLDPALHVGEWVDRYARDKTKTYDEGMARRELTAQLGPLWQSPQNAAPHVRCLFAAFALHARRDRDAALTFLGDIATSLPRDKHETSAGPLAPLSVPAEIVAHADVILAQPDLVKNSVAIAARHGFTAPALMSVLCNARLKAGVLAPAQFNFLKLLDRRLWYALHSLGFPDGPDWLKAPMPNPRVEAVGARDHWAVECKIGRPLRIPSIDRAAHVIRANIASNGSSTPSQEVP
jgi:intracellular multiplication protein IcmP